MKSIAFRYGLRMFAGFTALFLLAHLLGFSEHYYLRILNGVIHLAFIFFAIREYNHRYPAENDQQYVPGVAMGMFTSFVGVTMFCIFIGLFMAYNQSFFLQLKSVMPLSEYFTPVTASLIIFSEGTVVGLIGSYLAVRILDAQHEREHEANGNLASTERHYK